MKFLVVGLGNPGPEYADTRHNIGFRVLETMADGSEWRSVNFGAMATLKHRGKTLLLLKPDTYMNLSGKAVRYWLQQEKIEKSQLLVVLDDLHLDFGRLRIRGQGSDAGHNGLKSIDQLTGGNNYARLRCGIGNNYPPGKQADYVLSEWKPDEYAGLPELRGRAAEAALSYCAHGLSNTMQKFNP
ncbi:MAG: aminoacyl-tRNA hydrolase [Lewinella sp.]|nr:aminoacyl-tRNA hydrolase [Lewinella sp.]